MLKLLISEVKYNKWIFLYSALLPILLLIVLIIFGPFVNYHKIAKGLPLLSLIAVFIFPFYLSQKSSKEKRNIAWNTIPITRKKVAFVRTLLLLSIIIVYFLPIIFTQLYISQIGTIISDSPNYSVILLLISIIISLSIFYMDVQHKKLKYFLRIFAIIVFVILPNSFNFIRNNVEISDSQIYHSIKYFSATAYINYLYDSKLLFVSIILLLSILIFSNSVLYLKRKSYLD